MFGTGDQVSRFDLPGHIHRGDVAPWWMQGPYKFTFDRAAGCYIVLGFYGTPRDRIGQAALCAVQASCYAADSDKARFFAVSLEAPSVVDPGLAARFPTLHFMWDSDGAVHRAYGVDARMWIVLDPMLRVIEVVPFTADSQHIQALMTLLDSLPPPSAYLGPQGPVPVLVLPDVFEPEFCQHLIDCYQAHGGRESGFMQEINGRTVEVHDPDWKRRSDFILTDEPLIELIKARLARRVGIMVQRTFQFTFSRIERYLIACYLEEQNGHFGPHRDDTVKGTEHRRFAVSINLNADFDGGGVSFPEFSPREFKVPVGAALIFSASLLHRVSRVTRGRRYAFLPFIHDENAERLRVANAGPVTTMAPE